MRRANGSGHIVHLSGNRRKPWACCKTVGYYFNEETGKTAPKRQYLSYHKTRREAERALDRYVADPYCINHMTLQEVYDAWLTTKTDKTDATIRNYGKSLRKLEPFIDREMNGISRQEWQMHLDSLELTKATAHQLRVLLNGIIDYCVKREVLPISYKDMLNSLDFAPNKPSKKTSRKVFTQEEISYLWQNYEHDNIMRIMLVYIYTGMRFEELQTLKEEDCFDDYVHVSKSKTAAGIRDVPLSDKVKSLLPISAIQSYTSFRRGFMAVCEAMGTQHTIHDMRHTFITLLTEADVDSRVIKQIVGHHSDDITEGIYTHISMRKMLEAVNKI